MGLVRGSELMMDSAVAGAVHLVEVRLHVDEHLQPMARAARFAETF